MLFFAIIARIGFIISQEETYDFDAPENQPDPREVEAYYDELAAEMDAARDEMMRQPCSCERCV